jgi:sulfur-oxidizing protein SoxY
MKTRPPLPLPLAATLQRLLFTCLALLLWVAGGHADVNPGVASQNDNWDIIKANLFSRDQHIHSDDTITLITPIRAEDAAIVPITVTANIKQTADFYIEKIWLVVDNNPSPVVGVFSLTPQSGLASLSTRIRVNAYSNVRAIAATSDGKLHMATNFVKASGGCSAPASTNDDTAIQRRGKMKLRQQPQDKLTRLQLLISHPNYSGLQIDQLSRHWIPADYVNQIQLSINNKEVLSFVGGISMSENPSIRFYIKPTDKGVLLAEVSDSQGRHYRESWKLSHP